MIPHGLTDEHFQKAAAQIDGSKVPHDRRSVHYDLIINGKRYPPKYIVSIAAKIAGGVEFPASDFNAVEAKKYFQSRKYKIIDRRQEALKTIVNEDDESTFAEGKKSFRRHQHLERDNAISKKAKAKRLADTGKLECDVCHFDFTAMYGEHGTGFIEAHHLMPVSSLSGTTKTKIKDLALVCSNCHRMLHRGSPLLTISQLAAMLHK
jgi:predicted HNH restriction endonuclease